MNPLMTWAEINISHTKAGDSLCVSIKMEITTQKCERLISVDILTNFSFING